MCTLCSERIIHHGFQVSLCSVITVFKLSFCDSNTIQHFCSIFSLVSLACDYTSHHEMTIFVLSAFVFVGNFIFIMISYVFIGAIVVRMPSAKDIRPSQFAPPTSLWCAYTTDLLTLFIWGPWTVTYSLKTWWWLWPIQYWHLLDLIIYSLRNKEMQIALRKVLDSAKGPIAEMVNKTTLNTWKLHIADK